MSSRHPTASSYHWEPGTAPVAVVMISLNEEHNMELVLQNLQGWAQEVFLVDSYSSDRTVDIALSYGVFVAQRRFRGFGDQWNFALNSLPITAPWTMKLDPDERLDEILKASIQREVTRDTSDGFTVTRRLWFMGKQLPIRQTLLRVWQSGQCRFSQVPVNEHPLVDGQIQHLAGEIQHHDSPHLHHWLEKQNQYTTAEAISAFHGAEMAAEPRLLGTGLERRMWIKKHFYRLPFRYLALFLYHWLLQGAWRSGWVGYAWARLRSDVMRLVDYKRREIEITGRLPAGSKDGCGEPHDSAVQFE